MTEIAPAIFYSLCVRDELDELDDTLSEQFPTRRYRSPESRLAAALIAQALVDSRDIHVTSGLRQSALKWFSGAPALLSFDQACVLAGIDEQAVKGAIARGHSFVWSADSNAVQVLDLRERSVRKFARTKAT